MLGTAQNSRRSSNLNNINTIYSQKYIRGKDLRLPIGPP
jgi:hypothetical protein